MPIVPGYHGGRTGSRTAQKLRRRSIGFPVLIKASAGGGGKGMRSRGVEERFRAGTRASAARRPKAPSATIACCWRNTCHAPRHIEMQVFADAHGNCIHLFERDCSIQRRHQKVIEEAPAPGMTARTTHDGRRPRSRRCEGRRLSGRGHGRIHRRRGCATFYFMEMNTRLQVEHPVTEMITGLDLVEWQIRVAAGEELPLEQAQVPLKGHAIEARLYAEDPEREFLPSTRRLIRLRWPPTGDAVRVDTGVQEGDAVDVYSRSHARQDHCLG